MTEAGELHDPSLADVQNAVEDLRVKARDARNRVAEAFPAFIEVGESGRLPALLVDRP